MSKFNLSKFNINNSSKEAITGSSSISVETTINEIFIIKSSGKAESNIEISGHCNPTIRKFAKSEDDIIEIDTNIIGTVQKFSGKSTAEIQIDSSAISSLLGIDNLQLNNNLSLRPGQTLEIDLCDLTATIDGENAIHTISEGSDWFDLLPSENEVSISCNGTIDVEMFWKDRWL